jgi:hypothetical protein
VALVVREGHVRLKVDDASYALEKPPGSALFLWNSQQGPGTRAHKLEKLPDAFADNPPYPKKYDQRARADMQQALDSFSTGLTARLDAALTDATRAPDPSRRKLAVNALGAIDDADGLLEALTDEKHPDVRVAAIDELRFWLAQARDHDQTLYARAAKRFGERPADILMSLLLFNYSPQALGRPETYEDWIDYLTNANLAIRQTAAWHLYQVVSNGRDITYDAAGDSNRRILAQQAWRKLIPRGQMPPSPPKK